MGASYVLAPRWARDGISGKTSFWRILVVRPAPAPSEAHPIERFIARGAHGRRESLRSLIGKWNSKSNQVSSFDPR